MCWTPPYTRPRQTKQKTYHNMCWIPPYTRRKEKKNIKHSIVFFVLSSLYVWWCPIHIVLCFLFCPCYMYGGVLHILYCVFILSSLCVWWCPIHIVLCFLFCPRYVSGGVLYILYYLFCFVLVMCMVVSYTY
jgi:hypothetical protein